MIGIEMSDIPVSTTVSENISEVDPEVPYESTTRSNTQIPVKNPNCMTQHPTNQ